MEVNDVITDEVKIIAGGLNRYFSEVGANIIAELENEQKNNSSCRNTKFSEVLCKNSIFTTPTDEFEINNILLTLKRYAASCDDNITVFDLLNLKDHILEVLVNLFNGVLVSGNLLNELKLVRICPIYNIYYILYRVSKHK